ncbi:putative Thioredoxin [Blattamonas nauphoetae]|uniref:Thioredoxin n=1 Tax=Blattamonas nauphoetae TaxID=2049346 RepID=A0ABQ9YHN5_9EUKA|nr:putative Thioredoxin [Blattamonas nauphoetae]
MNCLLVVLSLILGEESTCEPLLLSSRTFNQTIEDGHYIVRFFAPWCPKCKRMEPEYLKLCENPPEGVTVANIDCEADNDFCQSLDITAYPRVLFFSEGKFVAKYELDYLYPEMKQWSEKLSRPVVIETDAASLERKATGIGRERADFLVVTPSSHDSDKGIIPYPFQRLALEKRNSISHFYHLSWPLKQSVDEDANVVNIDSHRLLERVFGLPKEETDAYVSAAKEYWADTSRKPPTIILSFANSSTFVHPFRDATIAHYGPKHQLENDQTDPLACPSFEQLLVWFNARQQTKLASFSLDMQRNSQLGLRKTVIAIVNGTENATSIPFIKNVSVLVDELDNDDEFVFVLVDHKRFPGLTNVYNISSRIMPDLFVVNWISGTNWTTGAGANGWTLDKMRTFITKVKKGRIPPSTSRDTPSDANSDFLGMISHYAKYALENIHPGILIGGGISILLIVLVFVFCCIKQTTQQMVTPEATEPMEPNMTEESTLFSKDSPSLVTESAIRPSAPEENTPQQTKTGARSSRTPARDSIPDTLPKPDTPKSSRKNKKH